MAIQHKKSSTKSLKPSVNVRKSNIVPKEVKIKKEDCKPVNLNPDSSADILKLIGVIGGSVVLAVIFMILLLMTAGCTYSVNLVDTHGEARNVLEETDRVNPTIDPTLTFPGAL